jgi:SSS family transporter
VRLPASALGVLLLYLLGITAFGAWLGRKRRSARDYFLAERSVPWWAVAACIVATETSTLTFVGVPGLAYAGDWTFLQLGFGYVIGRVAVALLLVPAYFRGEIFTSYELLQGRFGGGAVRSVSAAIFLATRTLGDGIRLHAAALVLSIAAGVPEWWCVLALGLAMILYTEEGGVRATVWTDTIQLFVYLAGALVCLFALRAALPDGIAGAWAQAAAAGKLRLVDASLTLRQPYTLLAGVVGGAFLTLATHGTDHYLVQRLLVAKSRRDAAAGLALSGVVVVAQFAVFLLVGTLLWSFYEGRAFARADEVLPTFVSTELPPIATGFILAAVVAAALSPSLNAMAGATLRDFWLPYVEPGASDARQVRLGRVFTVIWGVVQVGVALLARDVDSALNAGLAALGYASGPTVGAFLLAVLTRTVDARGALTGMLAGLASSLAAGMLSPTLFGVPGVAWTWNVCVGTVVTFGVGLTVSGALPRRALPQS